MALISRLQQSNLSSLIVLVFQFIAVFWAAHPREFLFLTFCNRFIHSSGVNSAEHAVQPSPALSNCILSLWAKRLPAPPRGIGYEGRDLRLIFQCFFALVCKYRSTNSFPGQKCEMTFSKDSIHLF
jgi:hypothetical protein